MKFGVRGKILIITVLTFLIAISVNTILISRTFKKEYSAALQSKMDVVANNLKSQIERLLNLGITIEDIEGFEQQCQEILQKNDEMAYVMVAETNGRILFHNDPNRHDTIEPAILKAIEHKYNQGTACLSEVNGRQYYNMVVPVGNTLGNSEIVVVVGTPMEIINSKIKDFHYYSSIVALISLSLATFLLLATLSVSVTTPLSKLVNTIQYIHDSSDLSKRVEITSRDELGDLARSFNRMTGDLQSTTTSIDNLNKEIAERRKAEQLLESVNQELKNFAYVISHDLKTPLRGIKNLAEWIAADYADKLDDEGKKRINLLMTRVDRMRELINGVLQYSRVGRLEEHKAVINLNEIVAETVDMIAPLGNVAVTVENRMPYVECSRTRITQVFQNLLSNAIKYMDKPQSWIKIGCVEENGFWKFSITDNGRGIKEEHFEKIFQLFQTVEPLNESESTGIGLTLVKKIIEMYGGRIWVQSTAGEYTTFFFTLPKQQIPAENKEQLANAVG